MCPAPLGTYTHGLGGGAAIGQAAPVNPVVPLTHTVNRLFEGGACRFVNSLDLLPETKIKILLFTQRLRHSVTQRNDRALNQIEQQKLVLLNNSLNEREHGTHKQSAHSGNFAEGVCRGWWAKMVLQSAYVSPESSYHTVDLVEPVV